MRIKEVQVEIPEYLYEESIRLTTMGLFRDFSDLVRAGIRHELAEAKRLIESESAGWEEGLAKLRARIEAKRAQTGYKPKPKSKEEVIDELRYPQGNLGRRVSREIHRSLLHSPF